MPRVRIVADYCSKGYQILDEDDASSDDGLAINAALMDRLTAWNDLFDARCDPKAYEDISGMRFDFVAFGAEGAAIARAVKRELPGWTVTYWDEALDWYLARDPRTYDPSRAEYEITHKDAFSEIDDPKSQDIISEWDPG